MAYIQHLTIQQGESFVHSFETGYDFSSSTFSARCKMRSFYNIETYFDLTTVGNQGIELMEDGTVRIFIPAELTSFIEFPLGRQTLDGQYDVKLTNDITGDIYEIAEGRLTIDRDITNEDTTIPGSEDDVLGIGEDSNGFVTKFGTNRYSTRLVASLPEEDGISVENPAGVLGNPRVSLDIDSLLDVGNVGNDDRLIVRDVSEGTNKSVTVAELNSYQQTQINTIQADLDQVIIDEQFNESARDADIADAQAIHDADETAFRDQLVIDQAAQNTALTDAVAAIELDISTNESARNADITAYRDQMVIDQATQDTALVNEIADRDNADAAIAADLAAESATRAQADADMTTRVDAIEVSQAATDAAQDQALTDAVTVLEAADTGIAADLATEATERSNADSAMTTRVDAIEVSQAATDAAQNTALASEVATLEAADTALQTTITNVQNDVDANETAQDAVNTTLGNSITTETTARTDADVVLQGNIDALETAVDTKNATQDSALATEVSQRTGSDNTLQTNIDGKVSLTGNESISGTKTFEGDVIVNGEAILNNATIKSSGELDVGDALVTLNAGEDGTPSVDAGIEIERGTAINARMIWKESADKWVGGLAGSEVAFSYEGHTHTESDITDLDKYTKAEIDGKTTVLQSNIDTKYDKSGGTLTGNIIVDTSSPEILFKHNGVNSAEFVNNGVFTQLKHLSGGTTITMSDSVVDFNKDIRLGAMGSNANSGATKGYIDNNFVSLTDSQTIAGAKTFTATQVIQGDTASAILALDTKTAGNSFISLRRNGANESAVYSLDDRLLLRRESATDTDLSIYDSYISANTVIRASEPVDDNDLTTKKFVDDNFIGNTGDQTINGSLYAKNAVFKNANPIVMIKANGTSQSAGS